MTHTKFQAICERLAFHFEQNNDERVAAREMSDAVSALCLELNVPRRDVLERCLEYARESLFSEEVTFYLQYKLRQMQGRGRRTGLIRQLTNTPLKAIPLDRSLLSGMALRQNGGRGALFEEIAATLVRGRLCEKFGRTDIEVQIRGPAFDCRSLEGSWRRFPDLYIPELSMMVEVKSGYTQCSKFVREQIKKDEWLLKSGVLSDVWWFLFYGGSQRLLDELDACGINALDLGLYDEE